MKIKKILFITGTRADFGKLKPLIIAANLDPSVEVQIFVTGMHQLPEFGLTRREVEKLNIPETYNFINQKYHSSMDEALSSTIDGLSRQVNINQPDMIIIHGDRVEALAGAIVGALNNIRVGHIEGGEISGTVDESIRHAITKLVHVHFTSNKPAENRLLQLGESENSIFTIGSPEMDLMVSDQLPSLEEVKQHYDISFERYAIFIYHPVVTDIDQLVYKTQQVIDAIESSGQKYIMILPNNDSGNGIIFSKLRALSLSKNVRTFPSIRFEAFLVLLKNADFIIGNSSCGVREAPFYSTPTINIGSRQTGRFEYKTILNVQEVKSEILSAIEKIPSLPHSPSTHFGDGKTAKRFIKILHDERVWKINIQKTFNDRWT